jgi:hypothetical protein
LTGTNREEHDMDAYQERLHRFNEQVEPIAQKMTELTNLHMQPWMIDGKVEYRWSHPRWQELFEHYAYAARHLRRSIMSPASPSPNTVVANWHEPPLLVQPHASVP